MTLQAEAGVYSLKHLKVSQFAALLYFRHKRQLSLILILAVTLSCAILGPENMKSVRYGDYAVQVENLRAGRGFIDQEGEVLHRYPPLYPLVLWSLEQISLAMGFSLYGTLAAFAIICNLVSAAIVWRIARTLGLSETRASAAAILFGLHPFVLYGVLIPLSETPFITLFCGGVLLVMVGVRDGGHRQLFGGGLLLGLACLVRPIGLLAPFLLGFVVLWQARRVWRERLLWAGLMIAGFVVVVAPWVMWVRIKSGEWIPVSSGGPPTLRDGLSFNHKAFREKLQLPEGVARLSEAAWAEYEKLRDFRSFTAFLFRQMERDPTGVLQTFLYKAARAWYGTDAQRAGPERLNMAVSLAFLTLVVFGYIRYWRHGGCGLAWLPVGGAILFWIMATIMLSIARYTTPAVALLAPFAACAWPGRVGRASLKEAE